MVHEWLVYCLKVQLLVAVFGLWSPVHSIQNHFKLLPNILNFKNSTAAARGFTVGGFVGD